MTNIRSDGVVQVARMKRARHMRRLFEDCLEIRARGHGGRGAPSGLARVPEAQSPQPWRLKDKVVVGLAPRRPWRTKRSVHVCQSQPPSPSSTIHSPTSTIILSHSFHQCCHTTTMLPHPRQGLRCAAQRHADLEQANPASRSKRSK